MSAIKIEKVNAQDVPLLREVALKSYSDHYLHLWYDEGQWYKDKSFSIERLLVEVNNHNSLFYLSYYNKAPVGFLKLNIDAPLEGFQRKNTLELERIYLEKMVEGKGIGRKLVELTFDIARQNNKDIVWLKAMDTSYGPIAFYQKMGFQITGTYRLKHPLMKEELRGMVIMTKNL
jgi:GNAT superfamily N-acetyltransferase